jgi:hypothetical protein
MTLYEIIWGAAAEDLGHISPPQIQLLRGGPEVVLTDGPGVVVTSRVADAVRAVSPTALLVPTIVWAPQSKQRERLADRFSLSGSTKLDLAAECVIRQPNGDVAQLRRPHLLARQVISETEGVFVLTEHPRIVVFSQAVRDVLKQYAKDLYFTTVPMIGEGAPIADEVPGPGPALVADLMEQFRRGK